MTDALIYPEATREKENGAMKGKRSSVSKDLGLSGARLPQARKVLTFSCDKALAVRAAFRDFMDQEFTHLRNSPTVHA
jgi:hypothetical protein